MSADAWLLLVLSVGLGLGLEILYMRARWAERSRDDGVGPRGPEAQSGRGGGNGKTRPERSAEDRPYGSGPS